MFTNQEPFPTMHWDKYAKMVKGGYRPSIPKLLGEGLIDLILSCWNREAKLRPGFSKIHETLRLIEAQDHAVA